MIYFEKLKLYQIKKGMKNETKFDKENFEDRPFTFKITKKRSPWTSEEDEAITALVNKYGTGNWTLIANEMSNLYGFKNRSGKQCRERWHNHLDPNINKDYWTEKEENILFMKHMEYGNKWSDIAKFLPGRTDNAIKNHFYSKLRKFIRKMLKQINKDNMLKSNGIDPNKYNSDRVYKMIKKNKLPYNNLNKEAILAMIMNYEKNNKQGKSEIQMLKSKTIRRKTKIHGLNVKENLYDQKINRRKITTAFPSEDVLQYGETLPSMATRTRSRSKTMDLNLPDINNDYIYYNSYNNFLTDPNQNQVSLYNNITNITTRSRRAKNQNIYTMPRSRRNIRKRILEEDFLYEDDDIQEPVKTENFLTDENGKELAKRNLNMIINKSVLFNNYVKEEEERRSSGIKSAEFTPNKLLQKDIFFPSAAYSHGSNLNLIPSTGSQTNLLFDERMYRTSNYETFPYCEQGIPLMSPINPNAKIYPTSTRNYFNIDMLNEGNYQIPISMQNYNILRHPGHGLLNSSGYISSPSKFEMTGIGLTPLQQQNLQLTPNKEIALRNKILINESDMIGIQNNYLARNSAYQLLEASKKEENLNEEGLKNIKNTNIPIIGNSLIDYAEIQLHKAKTATLLKKPSLDLTMINENETGNIFKQSLVGTGVDAQATDQSNIPTITMQKNIKEFPAIEAGDQEIGGRVRNLNEQIPKETDTEINNLPEQNDSNIKMSEDSNLIKNEEQAILPIQLQERSHEEEEKTSLLYTPILFESKSEETISVTNTSEKSGVEETNQILINELNINRFDLINMYNLTNTGTNREGVIVKPQSEQQDSNINLDQTNQIQQHETKAILNVSPKSAFVKMK